MIKVRPFHSPPWPLLFLAASTHIYALSIHSLTSKGNVRKSISTAFDDGNESKAHDSLTIRGLVQDNSNMIVVEEEGPLRRALQELQRRLRFSPLNLSRDLSTI